MFGSLLLVRGVDDLNEVSGLSSSQSPFHSGRSAGHPSFHFLAPPLRMEPASLGFHSVAASPPVFSSADQAAVDPIRPGPDGSPKGIEILGRNEFALRKFSASCRIYAPFGAARLRSPDVDGGRSLIPGSRR